ncbi:TonB-dependent receptor [Flavobacterium crassostreae]|uniref:TonB-dependent receptor n=1 Tax=Flavobacterium crassostreae TaxID=1763534 RepID=UPI001E57EBF7|nr:carboxypeptidase-like regulatory domain-containing protein [Flavobacterium crassostreae]
MKAVILPTVLFFCSLIALAQTKITLSGSVKNQNQQALIGANLSFLSSTHSFATSTDSVGQYQLTLPADFYSIEVHYVGFVSQYTNATFSRKDSLNFILKKQNSFLNEVIILTSPKKAIGILSGNKLTFSPASLKAVPSLMGVTDINKILQLTPGVQNSGDANGYLYIRGSDPGHNLMLYANAPIYGMAHLLGVFPFYNGDHIQEVHLDKSNTNPQNGGRLSATVAVLPTKKLPTVFSVKGNLGFLASQATIALPISKTTGLYLSGRKTYIDQLATPLLAPPKQNNKSDIKDLKYHFGDSNVTFIAALAPKHKLTVDAFVSGDVLKITDPDLALHASLKWNNTLISSSSQCQITPNTVLTNTLYFSQYQNNLELEQATVQMNIKSYVTDLGFSSAITYWVNHIPFESGLQYANQQLQPQKITVNNLTTGSIRPQEVHNKANSVSFYTSMKPQLIKNLTAELGLRLNYYSADHRKTTYLHAEPRVLLNYKTPQNNALFASYTRKNQYLNLITTSSVGVPTDFWVASTEGVPAQFSDEFSVGYNQKIKSQWEWSLSSFYRTMNNLIEYPYGVTQFNEITTFKNDVLVGKGTAYGLETMLKKDAGKFKGWLSYTLSWANRQLDPLNNGQSYYAKYDRRHNLAVVATYDLNSKWDFGITQIFSSGNRFTTPTSWYFINNNPVKEYGKYNNAQMPNYLRTDWSVNYYFIKTASKESALNFSVYNTFNIQNPIYTVLNVVVDPDKQKIDVQPERKTLYTILPSISWRFQF